MAKERKCESGAGKNIVPFLLTGICNFLNDFRSLCVWPFLEHAFEGVGHNAGGLVDVGAGVGDGEESGFEL